MRPQRLVLLGLPLGALAIAATTWPRGEWHNPSDPGFGSWVTSSAYEAWGSANLNGGVWMLFGTLALYALTRGHVEARLAQWATFLLVTSIAVFLPVFGVMVIGWPAAIEAGSLDAVQRMAEHRTFQVWILFASVAWVLGTALWGWVLRAWPVAAATFALGGVLLAYPFHLIQETAGAVLLLIGSTLIARTWAIPPKATPAQ